MANKTLSSEEQDTKVVTGVSFPHHWKPIHLGEMVKLKSGTSRPNDIVSTPELEQSVPVYGGNGILGYTDKTLTENRLLVIGRVGAYCGCVHIAEAPNWITDNALYSEKWLVDDFSLDFLAEYLKFINLNNLQRKGGQPLITQGILHNLKIYLPPIAEQKAIAHTLQTIQQAKESRQRELTLERERKAALMQDLFTYGTRGERQKLTEIGDIPESWEVVELGDVCKVSSGGTPSREKPEYWNGDIPWVKTGEISYNIITETEERISRLGLTNSAAKIIPSGTLLMAMYGQGVTRGRVAILGIDATINQACAAISTPAHISTEFLFYWLAHNYERIRLLGHGANQKNLNALIVKSIPIVLPAYEEQCVIAETLQACDRKIAALENEVAVLNELFYTTLENLMSGHLPITCR